MNEHDTQPTKAGMFASVSAPLAFMFGIVTTVAVFSFFGLIALGIVFLTGGSNTTTAAANTNTAQAAANTNTSAANALQASIDPASVRYSVGSGKLTYVEYTDLECPYCKTFHPVIDSLKTKYSDKMAFTTKHFPLNIHPKAERENGAAECAGKQGKFFEFIDKIFAVTPSNNKLDDAVLFTTATDLGLDMDKFRSCVENKDYAAVETADATEAQAVGATGTPFSILIDSSGKILTRFKGVVSESQLATAFDQYLK